jgi:type IV pilus assembly protein PilN
MAKINLLPWRAERRKQREREFYLLLGMAALAGVLVLVVLIGWMGARISNQETRNNYLKTEIGKLDVEIADIANLDKKRSELLSRKQVIEQLQSSRSQMVHLFDEMVKTIPDGTRLTSLKEVNDTLTLAGVAESNARVATYMRNINASPWMGQTELQKIENKAGGKGVDEQLPYEFSLDVKLNKPADAADKDQDDEPPAGDTAAGAAADRGTPAGVVPAAAKPAAPPPGTAAAPKAAAGGSTP